MIKSDKIRILHFLLDAHNFYEVNFYSRILLTKTIVVLNEFKVDLKQF